jgi:membrane associated rhomboid family serine protease
MIPIPFGTDRPQRRMPWANIALIVANVVIYAVGANLAARELHLPGAQASSLPGTWATYMLTPQQPHLYQFITYQFLHEGLEHIGFNMLFLYVFGNNLNEKLGHIGYLLFYLAGGVLAGCGQMLVSNSPTLGASGAISAVTGLFLVLLPRIHIKIFIWIVIYMDIWEVPSMYFILFKIAQDIYEQWVGGARVAYMAHLSGTAAGIAVGMLLLVTRLVQRDHYDLLAMLNRSRRRHEYRTIVARGYDPFGRTVTGPVVNGAGGESRTVASGEEGGGDPRVESLRAESARLLRLHETPDAAQRYLELRAIDPTQVLPPQDQVDVANQLMAEKKYVEAAAAYEDYLRVYPTTGAGQQEQIMLILGLIYARYVPRPERAKELFTKVLPHLHNEGERALAEEELRRLATNEPGAA